MGRRANMPISESVKRFIATLELSESTKSVYSNTISRYEAFMVDKKYARLPTCEHANLQKKDDGYYCYNCHGLIV